MLKMAEMILNVWKWLKMKLRMTDQNSAMTENQHQHLNFQKRSICGYLMPYITKYQQIFNFKSMLCNYTICTWKPHCINYILSSIFHSQLSSKQVYSGLFVPSFSKGDWVLRLICDTTNNQSQVTQTRQQRIQASSAASKTFQETEELRWINT